MTADNIIRLFCVLSASISAVSASTETALTCQGRSLRLVCPANAVIQITSVQLADSSCYGQGNCCPRSDDCTGEPTTGHRLSVFRRCDGQTNCVISTEKRKIGCGVLGFPVYNDFERINFNCIVKETEVENVNASDIVVIDNVTTVNPYHNYVTDDYDDNVMMTSSETNHTADVMAVMERATPTLTFVIVPVLLLLLLVVIATFIVCYVIIRKRRQVVRLHQHQYDNGMTNPVYLTYAQLQQQQEDHPHHPSLTYDDQTNVAAVDPIYELEKQPTSCDNVYSDMTSASAATKADTADTATADDDVDNVVYSEIDENEKNQMKTSAIYSNVNNDDDDDVQNLYSEPRSSLQYSSAASAADGEYYVTPNTTG